MKVSFLTKTDGKGLYSKSVKTIQIIEIKINYIDDNEPFGELLAKLNKKDWNYEKDNVPYTDETWLETFKKGMIKIGFSEQAVNDISYSEAGMQHNDCVSMDVGKDFLTDPACLPLLKESDWSFEHITS